VDLPFSKLSIIQILREEIDINNDKKVAQAVGINKYPIKIKNINFIISICYKYS